MKITDLNIPLFEIPGFPGFVDSLDFSSQTKRIAMDLHRDGFAVLRFPDPEFDAVAERIKATLGESFGLLRWREEGCPKRNGMRAMDAWRTNQDVRRLAINESMLELLSTLYGRKAWPFQTLNFPIGTEQHYHSDAVHFHSIPHRFIRGG